MAKKKAGAKKAGAKRAGGKRKRGGLAWVRAGRGRRYELRRGGETLASLTWLKALGTLAACEIDGRVWTFKRTGFLRALVTIREEGREENHAVFHPGWMSGGRLVFADGREFVWRSRGVWGSTWGFEDRQGRLVASFTSRGMFSSRCEVTPGEGAKPGRDTTLMAAFGWYLLKQMEEEMASAGAVVAVM